MADNNEPQPHGKNGPSQKGGEPPKKPTEDHDGHPTPHAPDEKPCCCDHITLYLKMIHVITPTDAPGPPLIAGLFGLKDDKVWVSCTNCDGKVETWPHDNKQLDCPKCEFVNPDAPLAIIKPNVNCWVSCHVRIQVFKANRFDDILKALNDLLGQLAQAWAAYASARSAGAAASILSNLLAKVDDLKQKITDLESVLTGSKENLMGEFFINFEGSLRCDAKLKDAIELPHDFTEISDNEVAFHKDLAAIGGQWEMELRAIRSCPAKNK